MAKIRAISKSKTINKIINRKNRSENGLRGFMHRFIPHSKDEVLSIHFFISILIKIGVNNMMETIINKIKRYMFNIIIYGWSLLYSEISKQKM